MIGKQATIPDIELELQDLVLPIDLHCDEELSEEQSENLSESSEAEVEPQRTLFKIVVPCGGCDSRLKIYVWATQFGIRCIEDLLLSELSLLCPGCRNGR
ncbi:E7 [Human papillomavirus type 185]|nr:E7 [Human papillomavirus type 185]